MRSTVFIAALLCEPFLALSQARTASADSLSKTEHAVARFASTHDSDALALLERLVNVNSGTQNIACVREVGRILRAECDALGCTTRWEDGAAFGRAGHLVAERTGVGPCVLLIGHLDTVFESDNPFQRWERLTDSTAKGPGSTDMKGGDVVMLYALKALRASGQLERMSITVVLNGDEESPGAPIAAAWRVLTEAGARSQLALGFEDGDGDIRTAVAARRGITATRGAAFGKSNVIPEHFIVSGDLRVISVEALASAKATMSAIVATPSPQTTATTGRRRAYAVLRLFSFALKQFTFCRVT